MVLIRLLAILSTLCCLVVVNGNAVSHDHLISSILSWFKKNRNPDGDKIYGHPKVQTRKGTIIGQTNNHAHSFYAIPYAEAPIGRRRFMPPVEKGFQAKIEASKPNPVMCYQTAVGKKLSEDCLVLTVHVPKNVNSKSFTNQQFGKLLPVMVWIHGGAFRSGGGTLSGNDGRYLSESTNTIVVTINYRLGALGFLVYKEGGVAFNGNQGLKDQQLALKWVNDNIRNFGGDPKQVTIFGESAGAQSVMLHLASKVSKPYFKRAIMESNPAVFDYPTLNQAKLVGDELVELLGCGYSHNSNIDCLRKVSPSEIVSSTLWISITAANKHDIRSVVEPFRPIVDGVEFPKQPLYMFQDGNWNKNADVIIGTNRQEMFLPPVINLKVPLSTFKKLNIFAFRKKVGGEVIGKYLQLVSSKTKHSNYNHLLSEVLGDYFFVCPTRSLARFISKTSQSCSTYLYSWEYSPCKNSQSYCHYSCHSCEIPYVFGTTQASKLPNNEETKVMSAMFSDFWGSFAHTGVPTSKHSDTWLKYDHVTDQDLHMKYPHARMETNHEKNRCDFWDSQNIYA